MDADVIVVGVGTMGSMAAWQLASAGVDVIGIDQFGIGDRRIAAGGESRGLVRSLIHRPGSFTVSARAIELWRQLQEESGKSLYVESGSLLIGHKSAARMQQVIGMARTAGPDFEVLDHRDLEHRYPAHVVGPSDVGVYEREGGVLRSDLAVIAAAQRAVDLGARMVTGHAVDRIESDSTGVTVEAGGTTYRARKVVVTPGPWTSALLPELAAIVATYRIMIAWYSVNEPALFTPERFPSFVRGDDDTTGSQGVLGENYFGFPSLDGGSIKFAKLNVCGPVTPTDRLDQYVEDELIRADQERLRATLHGVHDHPHRTLIAMEGFTADSNPVIGSLPSRENVIVAAGFSGSGFGYASAVGEILKDLATTGRQREHMAELAVDRFATA
ncbi:N-methyl-L-tryptophan oxidase [Rhodococcus sp. NPDC055024]